MPKQNTFTYTPTQKLPKLGKIKTTWDLSALYYKSENDPQIEKDIQATEKAFTAFAKKWEKKAFTASASVLRKALTEFEQLGNDVQTARPARYFSLRLALNVKDSVAQKRQALLHKRMRPLSDRLLFFTLSIGKIPKTKQKEYLKDPSLAHFKYYLERVFASASHTLSEAEEKIMNLKSHQSYGMWVDATEETLSHRTVAWKGKQVAIPEALVTLDHSNSKEKEKLWSLIITEMKSIGEFAQHEFNAIITDVRTEEDLRGYKKPYSSTALGYEDSEKSIENLVDAVSTKGFALSKKFYKLKAQYHGEKTLHYTRKYDSIGRAPEIPFEQAVTICRDVFYGVRTEYGELFDSMLISGQIDVFPKHGKQGGAFMSSETNQPIQVFLNHTSNFKSLETLAHEMGHAIHAHCSATQTPFYDGHSIATAETASTLFENLLFDAVYSVAKEKDKPVLLHDRITRDIATIQRQIAFFNCELEIHNTIHNQGGMTNEELAKCMTKHLRSYLGPAITVDENDGYSYVYISHLRYGFYVYTYAFGMLMSTLLTKKYQDDSSYGNTIDAFLKAGRSDTVANIFKSIGVDTKKEGTFTEALKNHEADIAQFAQFVKTHKA